MREVRTVDGADTAFFEDLKALSPDCAASVYFHLETLEGEDPDIAEPGDPSCELCGAIALRYEVFSASIPGCRGHRLILTIDRHDNVVLVHRVLKRRKRTTSEAYRLAASQLDLGGHPWEPRHDD
ncbi:MAG: hypothetical protein OIF48_15460 [Silicimonas sp.]|nr:hypothetical protein [Silicimonas sp.]